MTTVYGWWDWDAEGPGLVNRVTGERVVFIGRAYEPDLLPADRTWLRFDYLHRDLTFPFLVERLDPADCPTQCRAFFKAKPDGQAWRVDYFYSSALWRRMPDGNESNPPYGHWRRVDDCISDALACWPAVDDFSTNLSETLYLTGGWLNGSWNEGISRTEGRLVDQKGRDTEEDYTSWLFPLDETAPSAFEFHGWAPPFSRSGPLQVENPVLLEGLAFDDPELRFRPGLPEQTDLTQLAGKTAYLLSQDKRRLLYPYFGSTEKPSWATGHWNPCFRLLCVDDSIVASCSARAFRRVADGHLWSLGPGSNMISLRGAAREPSLYLKPRPVPGKPDYWNLPPVPSRRLWRHLQWALTDGWCFWPGSKAHSDKWLAPLSLVNCEGVSMSGGYLGGRWLIGPQFSVIV